MRLHTVESVGAEQPLPGLGVQRAARCEVERDRRARAGPSSRMHAEDQQWSSIDNRPCGKSGDLGEITERETVDAAAEHHSSERALGQRPEMRERINGPHLDAALVCESSSVVTGVDAVDVDTDLRESSRESPVAALCVQNPALHTSQEVLGELCPRGGVDVGVDGSGEQEHPRVESRQARLQVADALPEQPNRAHERHPESTHLANHVLHIESEELAQHTAQERDPREPGVGGTDRVDERCSLRSLDRGIEPRTGSARRRDRFERAVEIALEIGGQIARASALAHLALDLGHQRGCVGPRRHRRGARTPHAEEHSRGGRPTASRWRRLGSAHRYSRCRMGPEEAPPASGSFPRRAVRTVARPVTDPMHRRFDDVERRLDELTRIVEEVRDRVEADLASIVELAFELQRTVDALTEGALPEDPAG